MAKTSAARLLPPSEGTPSNLRLLSGPSMDAPRDEGAGPFESDLLRNAGIALGHNSRFFKMLYSERLEEVQKIQDKIDEYVMPEKRDSKVMKLMEKLRVLQEDLSIFEGMYRTTKDTVKDLEKHCQLEFAFDGDDDNKERE